MNALDHEGYNDWEENQLMMHARSNFYAFVGSVDFNTCKHVTKSYRELPSEVPLPPCSGRTVLCDAVLNDTCISIPVGSEDQFNTMRKNIYEEALFKVEDERYELDMVIENGASTIKVLQPFADKIAQVPEIDGKELKVDESLEVLHIRSITRIYGDRWFDVIKLFK